MVCLDCPTNEAGSINATTYGPLQGTGTVRESEITLTLGGKKDTPFAPASPRWGRALAPGSRPGDAPVVCCEACKSASLPRQSCPGVPVDSDKQQKLLITSNACPRFA